MYTKRVAKNIHGLLIKRSFIIYPCLCWKNSKLFSRYVMIYIFQGLIDFLAPDLLQKWYSLLQCSWFLNLLGTFFKIHSSSNFSSFKSVSHVLCRSWWQELPVACYHNLTHFSPVSHSYTPWKRQKTKGFLMFSGGIEMWHWNKIG